MTKYLRFIDPLGDGAAPKPPGAADTVVGDRHVLDGSRRDGARS